MAMFVGERAEDAAKEIAALCGQVGYLAKTAIAEIVQKAMDDDYDDRMADLAGS